jgi:UbiD family decarboxylase
MQVTVLTEKSATEVPEMSKDLRSYLDELLEKRPKDVVVVDREVDPRYEACAIVEKFERENKFPLVFFKNIKNSKIPLVINLGATYERLALSLGSPSVPQMVKDLAHREHHPIPVYCPCSRLTKATPARISTPPR